MQERMMHCLAVGDVGALIIHSKDQIQASEKLLGVTFWCWAGSKYPPVSSYVFAGHNLAGAFPFLAAECRGERRCNCSEIKSQGCPQDIALWRTSEQRIGTPKEVGDGPRARRVSPLLSHAFLKFGNTSTFFKKR